MVRELVAPLTVALIAEEAAGAHALRLLIAREARVAAVFSDAGGPGLGASVGDLAAERRIPVRPAATVRDPALAAELEALGIDLLLNVHSLHVVAPAVLDAPRLGAYNLHPGPLPERAGLNAPGWAIYEGAETHGVTLHRMTATVDEGAIAFIERFPLGDTETALELMTKCVRLGLPQLERLLALAAAGAPIPADPQDLSRRRWFGAGPPQNGRLEWDRPAGRIADFVRSCDYGPFPSPWPFPRCHGPSGELAIVAADATGELTDAEPGTVSAADGDGVLVAAADCWVRVDRIEVDGQRASAAATLGPGQRLGGACPSVGGVSG